jgi:class 3 adenylate cyclase
VTLNEDLKRDHGVSLRLRTGVNTGDVVVGTDERQVIRLFDQKGNTAAGRRSDLTAEPA